MRRSPDPLELAPHQELEKGPPFEIGDFVTMDKDPHIRGLVTAITIRGMKGEEMYSYEVNWFNNGCKNQDWFEEWRLQPWAE